MQLDPNFFAPESHAAKTALSPALESTSWGTLQLILAREAFDGSAEITPCAPPHARSSRGPWSGQ